MTLIRTLRFVFVIAFSFLFFSSYAQQLKVIGKPFSAAYDFAGIVAKTLQLNAPDSAHTKFHKETMQVVLKAPGNEAKWIVINFEKNLARKMDTIEFVSITGPIPDIIELYAILYDKNVKKEKPTNVFTGVDQEGEIRKVRTDYRTVYEDEEGIFGRINILKSNRTK
jgi:hypothetical protein